MGFTSRMLKGSGGYLKGKIVQFWMEKSEMHEFSTAQGIMEVVLNAAKAHNAKRVTEVSLEIGALTLLNPKQLIFSLQILSKKTVAEGAKFKINYVPARLKCSNCGYEGKLKASFRDENHDWLTILFRLECPNCQSKDVNVLEGKSCVVKGIKINRDG